jgi:hypothetical protein
MDKQRQSGRGTQVCLNYSLENPEPVILLAEHWATPFIRVYFSNGPRPRFICLRLQDVKKPEMLLKIHTDNALKKSGTPFVCNVRFRNDLPEVRENLII